MTRRVRFALNFPETTWTLPPNTPEVGEAREALAVVYRGRDLSIAFNPEFLMDPLRNLCKRRDPS